jgi:ABC-type transport system involved in multi-copper enzyme maturation permease subunit
MSGEYATGMIRSTLAAVPRRLPVLLGKTAIFASFVFVIMLPTAVGAFRLGQWMLSNTPGVPHASFGAPGVTRAVIGAALYVAAIGLFGLALGTLIRNTAGTIATMFGILLVLPIIVHFLPTGWFDAINPYLPSNAGLALMTVRQQTHELAPWSGFGVFCGYVALTYLLAGVMLRRRDS